MTFYCEKCWKINIFHIWYGKSGKKNILSEILVALKHKKHIYVDFHGFFDLISENLPTGLPGM